MKTTFFRLILLCTCTALIAVACTSDVVQPGTEKDQVSVLISADAGALQKPFSGDAQGSTRVTNNVWNEDDAIGVIMIEPVEMKVFDTYKNCCYKTKGDGKFAPSDGEHAIFFPSNDAEVSFKSYYPYKEDLSSTLVIPVSTKNQTRLSEIDLMTAEHLSGTSTKDPNVKLHFHHRLAKVVVKLSSDNDASTTLAGAKVVMKGLKTEATYHLMEEELVIENSFSVTDVEIPVSSTQGEAILLPRAAGEGVAFEITTTDGGKYTAIMSSSLELKSEYVHTFNIRLKSSAEVSATVEPWLEGPEQRYDLIRVVTGLGKTEGFNEGHALDLFLKEGTNADFARLNTFTYDGNGNWTPETPLYWESITANPAMFRGTVIYNKALNDTQMDDILVSEDIVVDPFTGINLTLAHAGTKVNTVLRSSDGTYTEEALKNASIVFPSYLNLGSCNDKGEFVTATSRGNIKPENNMAIFPPQTIAVGEELLKVEIEGRTYTIRPEEIKGDNPADIVFGAGKATTLVINIVKTGMAISAEVTGWTEMPDLEFNDVLFFKVLNQASSGFAHNDLVKFYTLTPDGNAVDDNVNEYKYAGGPENGTFSPTGTPWYRDDFETGDLIAGVYPSSASELTAGASTFPWTCKSSGRTNAHADDIMLAVASATRNHGEVQADGNVYFEFRHVLGKISINLIAGEGFTNDEVAQCVLEMNNFKLSGTMDVIAGTATPSGNATAAFNPVKLAQTYTLQGRTVVSSYEAFVMPQTIAANTAMVTVKLNGAVFEVKIEADKLFAAGTHHNLNLTLHKTGVEMTASIVDWNKVPDIDIDLH